MNNELIREAITHIRGQLREFGDVGQFLLGRIDASITGGIEEFEEEVTYSGRGRPRKSGKAAVTRRAPTDLETLTAHVRVLKAYLLDLPAAVVSAQHALSTRAGVEEIVISFDRDVEISQVPDIEKADVIASSLGFTNNLEATRQAVTRLETLISSFAAP